MVKWKGINLIDMGIIVEESPQIPKAKREYETYKIDGRNGVLTVDKGTYGTVIVTLKCHFNSDNINIDDIKAFLDGYGTLSLENGREYTAMINNQISFEKVLNFKKFTIQFMVNPISYDINESEFNVVSSTQTYNINNANYDMMPIIRIIGSGDVSITINHKSFYLYDLDGEYVLDSENKVIVDSNGLNCAGQMLGDFPVLLPGNNEIIYSGSIQSFIIKYRKAHL